MRALWLWLAVVGVLAAPASAVIGTVDDVPAATLLLPYFEVDLDDPNGVDTLFSINNASASAVLAHVIVWTDLSVQVLDFDVYLTGYDVQTINLRDICQRQPAGDGLRRPGPDATRSARRARCRRTSTSPAAPASCRTTNPALDATFLDHLQSTLTGQASPVVFGGLAPAPIMATASRAATSRSTP